MDKTSKATDKQISMLCYMARTQFKNTFPDQIDERGANMKYAKLADWAEEHLDKYQISALMNIAGDEDFTEEWREGFITHYLKTKGYEGI